MVPDVRYQVGIVDADGGGFAAPLQSLVESHASELGLDPGRDLQFFQDLAVADMNNAWPKVTVYFGGLDYSSRFDTVIRGLVSGGDTVLPVVPTLVDFPKQVPAELRPINGMELSGPNDLERVAALVMESLHLLRRRRRIFISYKRVESQTVATQLYHELDARSFDPFLDTHSIRQGDPFQERLWHRMADSDLSILLYTKTVLDSGWVEKELDRADAMSITVLQVIWPNVKRDPRTDLFEPYYLDSGDFDGESLLPGKLNEIVIQAERLRARSLAARETKLVKALCGLAAEQQVPFTVQRTRCVDLCAGSPDFVRVFLGIGVPDALSFQEATEPLGSRKPNTTLLMYDPFSIAPYHQKHLDWLDTVLPIKSLKPEQIAGWLQTVRCS